MSCNPFQAKDVWAGDENLTIHHLHKYRHLGEPVHLVAVEFSAETRNVAGFEAELA